MVEIKIKIKEDITKSFGDLNLKGIKVSLRTEGKNATENEKEVAKHYEELFNSKEKIKFVNKSTENKKAIDDIIEELKNSLGI